MSGDPGPGEYGSEVSYRSFRAAREGYLERLRIDSELRRIEPVLRDSDGDGAADGPSDVPSDAGDADG